MVDQQMEASYTAFVESAWPGLVRAAVFLGAAPTDAEDLAQTTLVRCYTAWERVQAADNTDAYVYRMLLNNLRDVRRSRWWRDRREPPAASDGLDGVERLHPHGRTEDSSEATAIADAVRRALGALSKVNREVVVLRYFVQLTEAQTAEALGVPAGTVKSRLSRALAALAADDHLLDVSGGRHD